MKKIITHLFWYSIILLFITCSQNGPTAPLNGVVTGDEEVVDSQRCESDVIVANLDEPLIIKEGILKLTVIYNLAKEGFEATFTNEGEHTICKSRFTLFMKDGLWVVKEVNSGTPIDLEPGMKRDYFFSDDGFSGSGFGILLFTDGPC